jgi:hypothetical protein
VSADDPFARLPDQIILDRHEVAIVLYALDLVEFAALPTADRARVRKAIRLVTSKLWSELGGILDEDGDG